MNVIPVDQSNTLGSLVRLVEILQEIDTSAPDAKINEESIDDNNGGRIIL